MRPFLFLLAALPFVACGTDIRNPNPVDADEDGVVDSTPDDCERSTIFPDADLDGLGADAGALQACEQFDGWVAVGGDCDDLDAAIGAGFTYYADVDGDGTGDPATPMIACVAPDGFVDNANDTYPACDGELDACGVCDGPGASTWYADVDGDGVGDERSSVLACEAPDGFVAEFGDILVECETDELDCAGVCGGSAENDECGVCEGPGAATWYVDTDGDGIGVDEGAVSQCDRPEGAVDISGDPEPECATNDTDTCGLCAGPGLIMFFADADGDGLGDRFSTAAGCEAPIGHVENNTDPEPLCATNDSDECGICAGPGPLTVYADVDGDGVGDERAAIAACDLSPGFTLEFGDPQPECATDDTDECGVCAGGNATMDCVGVCDGAAVLDGCSACTGGTSGNEPSTLDTDRDGIPDACDLCEGAESDRFVIQWNEVSPFAGAGGPYTFQVTLYSNGEFRYQYWDLGTYEASATVGYQSQAGEDFTELGFGSRFPTDHPVVHFRGLDDGGVAVEYTPPMSWLNIADSGTRHPMPDDGTVIVEIGFDFVFFGQTYTEAIVNSNGFISFTEPIPGYSNTNLPNVAAGALLSPLWDDLNPTRGGDLYTMFVPRGCALDCAGQAGGVAFTDTCGDCTGGDTGIAPNSNTDCFGVCHGEAELDICGVCVGGTTGVDPSDPLDCPMGVDLMIDQDYLASTMSIEYLEVPEGSCLIAEGCVRGSGNRKLLRFGTRIGNIGNMDLSIGVPPSRGESTDIWTWDNCHGHHHYADYAAYDLFDVANDELIPIGSKTGFCVMDIGVYDTSITTECNGYNCGNQGISAGCQDTYGPSLQCQWIDVTDIIDGTYDVIVTTNPVGNIEELNYDNNSNQVRVEITGDDVAVVDAD
jgi:hypothetical protein